MLLTRSIKKNYAYEIDDGVYFDVSKDEDYGKLSNRDPEQMEAGARLEPNTKKRNPGDFALPKSKPGEPAEVQFDESIHMRAGSSRVAHRMHLHGDQGAG